MSKSIHTGGSIIYCPNCGIQVFIPVEIDKIELWDQNLTILYAKTTVTHNCIFGPDTDGLRPIDRFIKHGALDDQGRNQ